MRYITVSTVGAALIATSVLTACSNQHASSPEAPETSGEAVAAAADTELGAAELWEQNCTRCHNIRGPETLSDAQWDIVAHHMRVRGGLLASEHRKIVDFLKASN